MTVLRDKNTTQEAFRAATEKLATILAAEAGAYLVQEKIPIETPISFTEGYRFRRHIVLIPILRSGLALLYPFLHFYPDAKVGFIGMRRDEVTAEPHQYYHNLPKIEPCDDVLILEPMIATGGSGTETITMLKAEGVKEERIIFIGIVAAPEGLQRIQQGFPKVRIHSVAVDECLNDKKFIVPGLGDFGDRYFGT